jgi:hypothetical protein
MAPESCASSGCSYGRALGKQRAEHGSSGAFARATRLRRSGILGNRELPDGDGLALTDELREASPGAALLVMSATVE